LAALQQRVSTQGDDDTHLGLTYQPR
jgi:hypothetical protein